MSKKYFGAQKNDPLLVPIFFIIPLWQRLFAGTLPANKNLFALPELFQEIRNHFAELFRQMKTYLSEPLK